MTLILILIVILIQMFLFLYLYLFLGWLCVMGMWKELGMRMCCGGWDAGMGM